MTLTVINKTTGDLTSNLRIDGFTPAGTAQVHRYSQANASTIVREADVNVSTGGLSTTFPGYSITLLVVPTSPSVLPVPKPQIGAVVNAASYATPIAPGQIVTLFGTGLGPEKLSNLELNASGLVADTVSETRVLFDGMPAPLIYVSAKQASAVVPYAAALNPAAHVQVEYRGHRSDPFEVAVAASAPAIFSMDMSGSGQGAILNENASINSVLNPAAAGSIVVIYLTGEGQTDLPGVDGRIAGDILAKPLLPVSVEIGGLPASIEYAGAAPQSVAGLMQINARMSRDVQPGPSVAVRVKIGNANSPAGVTLAVK